MWCRKEPSWSLGGVKEGGVAGAGGGGGPLLITEAGGGTGGTLSWAERGEELALRVRLAWALLLMEGRGVG